MEEWKDEEFDFEVTSSRSHNKHKPSFDQDALASLAFDELTIKKKKKINKERPHRRSSLPLVLQEPDQKGEPEEYPEMSLQMKKLNIETSIVEDLHINQAWGTITPKSRNPSALSPSFGSSSPNHLNVWEEAPESSPRIRKTDLLDGDMIEERISSMQSRRRSSLPLNPMRIEKHKEKSRFPNIDEVPEGKQIPENVKRLILEANMGWTESQFSLGYCYDTGSGGCSADTEKAIHWYTEAAQNGHVTAQNNLGVIMATGHRGRIKPNPAEAFAWYKKAGEHGHPNAEFHVGLAYLKGDGLESKDLVQAFRWFKKAAKRGHVLAQTNVGAMYMSKQGVDQDFKKAKKWLRKASASGSAIASHNLAVMYAKGYGVPIDDAKKKEYLKKAMEGRNRDEIPKELSEATLKRGNALMNM